LVSCFQNTTWINIAGASQAAKETGHFSGRVSKVNKEGGLVRLKVSFPNMRYLNKKDQVTFWNDSNPAVRCNAYVVGKSDEYILLRVPDFTYCIVAIHIAPAVYMKLFSQDLVNNIKMGRELVSILLKKRLAIHGQLTREKKELDKYIEKVSALNDRYGVLRNKLQNEWREELGNLEDDRNVSLRNYKSSELRLEEIDYKLEKYKIDDKNLVFDRWSLDPRLFYKK